MCVCASTNWLTDDDGGGGGGGGSVGRDARCMRTRGPSRNNPARRVDVIVSNFPRHNPLPRLSITTFTVKVSRGNGNKSQLTLPSTYVCRGVNVHVCAGQAIRLTDGHTEHIIGTSLKIQELYEMEHQFRTCRHLWLV